MSNLVGRNFRWLASRLRTSQAATLRNAASLRDPRTAPHLLLGNVAGACLHPCGYALPPFAHHLRFCCALHRKWPPGKLWATPIKGTTTSHLTGKSGNVNTMDPEATSLESTSLEAAATTTLTAAPIRPRAPSTLPATAAALPAASASLAAEDQGLLERILSHFKSKGRTHEWVVGTADQAAWRLFTEHRANRKADAWVYDRASSPAAASAIAAHLAALGARPFVGSGNEVYAYHLAEGAEA